MDSPRWPRLGVSLVGLALVASVMAGVAVEGGSRAAAEEMAPGALDAPLVCDGDDVPVFFTPHQSLYVAARLPAAHRLSVTIDLKTASGGGIFWLDVRDLSSVDTGYHGIYGGTHYADTEVRESSKYPTTGLAPGGFGSAHDIVVLASNDSANATAGVLTFHVAPDSGPPVFGLDRISCKISQALGQSLDSDDLACDVAGAGRGEESDRFSNVFGGPNPTERNLRGQLLTGLALNVLLGHVGLDEAGRDSIDGDPTRGQLARQGAGHADEARLGRDVANLAGVAHLADDRGEIDDAARLFGLEQKARCGPA